jgi:hypothetical protein
MVADHMEMPEKGHSTQPSNGDLQLINTTGEIRRIPIPSSDPNDPLNYSKWRKLGILICCCWFSIFSLVLVGGLGPILGVFIGLYAPTGKSIQQVVNLTTYPSLVMAFGKITVTNSYSHPLTDSNRQFPYPSFVHDVRPSTYLLGMLYSPPWLHSWCRCKQLIQHSHGLSHSPRCSSRSYGVRAASDHHRHVFCG